MKRSGVSGNEKVVIAIDSKKIVFNRKGKFTMTRKLPPRPLAEVYNVVLLESPKRFSIEYKDGKSDIYDAESATDASTLLLHLLWLHTNTHKERVSLRACVHVCMCACVCVCIRERDERKSNSNEKGWIE